MGYEEWRDNLVYRKKVKPRTEKKWWRRLIAETRRSNLDKISRMKPPKTFGEWFDLQDLKRTTKGYRKKR